MEAACQKPLPSYLPSDKVGEGVLLSPRMSDQPSGLPSVCPCFFFGADLGNQLMQGCRSILKSPKKSYIGLLIFKALKCLENKGFVSRGLKIVLIF